MMRNFENFYFPRIINKVQSGLQSRLTVLCAPAGYGKTTILQKVMQTAGMPVIWMTIHEEDNSLPVFLSQLIQKLQQVGWDVDLQDELFQDPGRVFAQVEREICLVFDDYQLVQSKSIHEAVLTLIQKIPQNVHLFICTRKPLPFPLSKFRLRGELVELFSDQLALTFEETQAFLSIQSQPNLLSEHIQTIYQLSEGWIAMIHLISEALSGTPQFDTLLRKFSGSYPTVYSFLEDEIYAPLAQSKKDFLLSTCILNQLTPDLCAAITKQVESAQIMAALVRDQILQPAKMGYRYHPLLANFLQNKLIEKKPGKIIQLHQRAAEWYERAGQSRFALDHYLEAGNCDHSAALINQMGWDVLNGGEYQTILNWCERLENIAETSYPGISEIHGFALIQAGNLDKAQVMLENLSTVRAMVGTARIALYTGQYEAVEKVYQGALSHLMDSDETLRCQIEFQLGMARLYIRDLSGAEKVIYQALARAERIANFPLIQITTIALSLIFHNRGNYYRSITLLERVMNTENNHLKEGTAMILARLAQMHLELGHIQQATDYIVQSLNLGEPIASPEILAYSYLTAARIARLQGNFEQAVGYHQSAARLAPKGGFFERANLAERMLLYVVSDEFGVVESWAAESGLTIESAEFTGDESYLVLARLYLRQGKYLQAVTVYEKILAQSSENDWRMAIQQITPWLAMAQQLVGLNEKARLTFAQAIQISAQNGFCLAFLEMNQMFPAEITEMLTQAQKQAATSKQAAVLLEMVKIHQRSGEPVPGSHPDPSPDLTNRIEVRVFGGLRVFRGGLELAKKGWRTERARELMAYFAVNYQEPVLLETLLETFWPGRSPNEARRLLHTNMYYLRRTLLKSNEDLELFIYRSGVYTLNLQHFWIDLKEFDDLANKNNNSQALMQAAALSNGECLAGMYDSWVLDFQHRYDIKKIDMFSRLTHLTAKTGNLADACTYANKILEIDPFHETTVRQLMSWYLALGDQPAAYQCYETLRIKLADEMGITPSQDTIRIASLIAKE